MRRGGSGVLGSTSHLVKIKTVVLRWGKEWLWGQIPALLLTGL